MLRGDLCYLILLGLLGLVNGKPNILVFVADDMGYGDLGCYGNSSVNTPNIDSIAHEGVKMTQHLTAASLCTPSRAALLTGRYPVRSGMVSIAAIKVILWQGSSSGLPESEVTFAEVTREAGYRNGYIGKWHLGDNTMEYGDHRSHPLGQGFDYFYGLLTTNQEDFGGEKGTKVILSYRPSWYLQILAVWYVSVVSVGCLYKMGLVSWTQLLGFIIIWTINVSVPYLLMENLTLLSGMLHRNYDVVEQPIQLAGLSQRLVKEGVEFIEDSTNSDQPFLLVMSWIHMHVFISTAKQFEGKSKFGRYGDALNELDWSVGQVLDSLRRQNVLNNTLVYFTSDNGGHLELGTDGGYNGNLKGGKSHGAPDGGIRVPGMIKWPGVIKPNTITDEPTSQMDIFNLLLIAAGSAIPTDRTLDGRNILPLLTGETSISPHEFLFHYCGQNLHAVRYRPRFGSTTWKLVTHEPQLLPGTSQCRFVCDCNQANQLEQPLLYDVTGDPGETTPVDLHSSVYKNLSKVMIQAISDHQETIEPVPSQFTFWKLVPRPHWQPCCNGIFPFNCECSDPKFPSE